MESGPDDPVLEESGVDPMNDGVAEDDPIWVPNDEPMDDCASGMPDEVCPMILVPDRVDPPMGVPIIF